MNSARYAWFGFSLVLLVLYLVQLLVPPLSGWLAIPSALWFTAQLVGFVILGLSWYRCWRSLHQATHPSTQSETTDFLPEGTQTPEQLIGPLVHEINQPLTRLRQRINPSDHPELNDDLSELSDTVDLVRRVFEDQPQSRWFATVPFLADLDQDLNNPPGLRYQIGVDWLFGDRPGLILSLKNVVKNSLEARENPDQTILVQALKQGPEFVLGVRDQSGGMDPRQAQEVQDDKPLTDSSGMGLGLYIARRVVRAHGGRSYVSTEPDEGTEVSMTLPFPGTTEPAPSNE